jgi:hypothetical protein
MRKILLFLFAFFIFAGCCFATTTNSYDKYGTKTGSFKTNSNGVTTQYDKYCSKFGTFKTDSSGRTTHYDKYGRKVGSSR